MAKQLLAIEHRGNRHVGCDGAITRCSRNNIPCWNLVHKTDCWFCEIMFHRLG